jgi:hypothetical protein
MMDQRGRRSVRTSQDPQQGGPLQRYRAATDLSQIFNNPHSRALPHRPTRPPILESPALSTQSLPLCLSINVRYHISRYIHLVTALDLQLWLQSAQNCVYIPKALLPSNCIPCLSFEYPRLHTPRINLRPLRPNHLSPQQHTTCHLRQNPETT